MALRKLTRFEQIGVAVAIGVVGMFFYLKLVYDPTVKKYSGLKKNWVSLERQVVKLKDEELYAGEDIEELKKKLGTIKKDLKDAETSLVKDKSQADVLITEVFRIAERNHLQILNYDFLDKPETAKQVKPLFYQPRYYNIALIGRYENFINFLNEVGHLPQLITVEKVDLDRAIGAEEKPLQIKVLLSI
jgi:Tfp pilus assembly protein PilO